MDRDELRLTTEEMRTVGYRVVDLLVDHFDALPEKSTGHTAEPAALDARLRAPMPETGRDPLDVLEQVVEDVLPHTLRVDHPRFFGFVPSPSNFVGVMADALAAGYNVFSGTWMSGSGAAEIELVTIDWLRALCGLPASAGGLFTSGGSMANVTALAVARRVELDDDLTDAVVYASDQTHSSVERGLRLLGFAPEQFRRVPTDDQFRLDVEALRRAMNDDRAAGRRPFCIVANAGTTNTGAVDPLLALAQVARDEELWLHVDGAYGAAAVFCERGRDRLEGIGAADSIALDPHKWLFQPFEMGGVLVRERRHLKETFHIFAEYLEDAQGEEEEVNFGDYGIQLTRSFRALKLWMTIQVFGREHIARAIERGFERAEDAERMLAERSGWTVVTPAEMGIVTFRCVPEGRSAAEIDALNRRLARAITRDGFAVITTTELRGRPVLRLCPINPRTTAEDVRATLDRLDKLRHAL